MAYSIPAMPLMVNVWTFGTGPPAAPRLVTTGNLSWGRRVLGVPDVFQLAPGEYSVPTAQLLLPARVDIRGPLSSTQQDTVEVPAGSGRFYDVLMVDDFGRGFPNEHRFAILTQQAPVATPWP